MDGQASRRRRLGCGEAGGHGRASVGFGLQIRIERIFSRAVRTPSPPLFADLSHTAARAPRSGCAPTAHGAKRRSDCLGVVKVIPPTRPAHWPLGVLSFQPILQRQNQSEPLEIAAASGGDGALCRGVAVMPSKVAGGALFLGRLRGPDSSLSFSLGWSLHWRVQTAGRRRQRAPRQRQSQRHPLAPVWSAAPPKRAPCHASKVHRALRRRPCWTSCWGGPRCQPLGDLAASGTACQ